ncbi:RICIN domain-containing protein [Streptomyces sp. H39-S7]|uniref:RICIN domain-containing protein n=1 Tax=Streptomyces sp. H39-S7 TaxID=3004357 RepID=UPI0022AEDC1E|nr:RICIN domain-containing protein [Streptomyces sp. H39-S7]MCZ4126011.1 RICIN domain-containing protein [Streptomyces sp. H39-S7]
MKRTPRIATSLTVATVRARRRPGLKRIIAILAVILGVLATTQPAEAAPVSQYPGITWNDTSGKAIQAHGGGLIKVGSTYYWLGEDKTNGSPFQNVTCYSSTDLKNWTFVRNVLTRQPSGDLGPNRIVERPHVIYNSSTAQYVMYMHIDSSNYSERKAGVATSSSVCGNYTYHGSSRPLGHDSLDDNLFLDGNTAYFMSEDRSNGKLQIYRLSPDFLTVAALVKTLDQYESPAIAKVGGLYYLFGSHLTGWSTNDNQYATATSITGNWSSWRSFAPPGTNTCNSQTTSIQPIAGSSTTSYVFMGDRWNSGNLTDSRYIWEPLTVNDSNASITCNGTWTVDTQTGVVGGRSADTVALRGRASGRCLDVPNESTANDTQIAIWDCNTGANQLWTVNSSKELVVYGSKCLDAAGARTMPGSAVIIYDCHGGTNQQWNLNSDGTIINAASGLCLDVTGAATGNGAPIGLWTCNGGGNQRWDRQ